MKLLLAFLKRMYRVIDRTQRVRLWLSVIVLLVKGCATVDEQPFTYDSLAFDTVTSRLIALKQNSENVVVEVHDVDFNTPKATFDHQLISCGKGNPFLTNKIGQARFEGYYFQIDNLIYKTDGTLEKASWKADRTDDMMISDVDISSANPINYSWINKELRKQDIHVEIARLSPSKQVLALATYADDYNNLLIIDLKKKSTTHVDLRSYGKKYINDLAFAGNEKLLITGPHAGVLSYGIQSKKISLLLDSGEQTRRLLPLEKDFYAVSTEDNHVLVFRGQNGQIVEQIKVDDTVTSMTYSAGYKCLAIGGQEIHMENLSSILSQSYLQH